MLAQVQTEMSVTVTEGFEAEVSTVLVDVWKQCVPTSDAAVYHRKAMDVLPQYIQFIGSASVWAILAPAAAAFLARMGYLLADDAMAIMRGKLQPSPKPVEKMAAALHAAGKRLRSPGQVFIGINLPDDRWGTSLELDLADEAALTERLSIFVLSVERLTTILNDYCERGEGPLGKGTITISEAGHVEIEWMSQRDFKRIRVVLPKRE